VRSAFARALDGLDEEQFQSLYGRWDPLTPAQVADLLAGSGVRWLIAGGRAARIGAEARHHGDTDVVIDRASLAVLRQRLQAWDLWEAHDGTLRPLLPGNRIRPSREQLWARRNAYQPWQLDLLLYRWGPQWVFKKDPRIQVPWDRATQVIDGITFLRPEIALLHKAHLDRQKDRADLAAARLDPAARRWLVSALEQLGHHEWARLAGIDRP
jgi:hypothetical protein